MGSTVQNVVTTLVLLIFALVITVTIFVIDLNTPNTLAIGAMYAIVVVYNSILKIKNVSVITIFVCSALILIAAYYAPETKSQRFLGVNIIISLLSIWICYILLYLSQSSLNELEKIKNLLEIKVENRTKEVIKNQILLEKKERKYKELLDSAPDATMIINEKGEVEQVNNMFEKVFGFKMETVVGMRIESIIPERGFVYSEQDYFKKIKNEFLINNNEIKALNKNGEEFPVEVSISPIKTESGTLLSVSLRDITERKEAETNIKLYNAQLESKNKELEQFVYIASHDLQEPLRTISVSSSILKEDYNDKLEEDGKNYLKFIQESSLRMKLLIQSLLEYGRIGNEKEMEEVDTEVLVTEVKSDLKEVFNHTQGEIVCSNLPKIMGYPQSLKVLFQNLISNSLKFKEADSAPLIEISYEQKNDIHWFYFKDNGIGIEAEYSARIFKIFQRLHTKDKYSGSGIGLAHCQKVVDLHNGEIYLDPTYKDGAMFVVKLPFLN